MPGPLSSFTAPLELRAAPRRDVPWATTRELSAWVGDPFDGLQITVPAGFETDLGSIPRVLWPLLPRDDARFAAAFVVHDWLCERSNFPRLTAAAIFLELLLVLAREHGAAAWRVWAMFAGVLLWAVLRPYPLR